ncbi:MAG: hypothetical protein IPH18_17255 [Chitinophagaceae bacterium]|nr:hypothetical protein [Chitinophagaceae bacterium]
MTTFLQIEATSKPTLLGGVIIALVIGYIIVGEFRGKNYKKGTNKKEHSTDNFGGLLWL